MIRYCCAVIGYALERKHAHRTEGWIGCCVVVVSYDAFVLPVVDVLESGTGPSCELGGAVTGNHINKTATKGHNRSTNDDVMCVHAGCEECAMMLQDIDQFIPSGIANASDAGQIGCCYRTGVAVLQYECDALDVSAVQVSEDMIKTYCEDNQVISNRLQIVSAVFGLFWRNGSIKLI